MDAQLHIHDYFDLKDRGTVLTGYLDVLGETHNGLSAIEELHYFVKPGDIIHFEDDELIVKDVSRNGILIDPIIYGKNVSLLFETLPKPREYYFNKRFLLKTDK